MDAKLAQPGDLFKARSWPNISKNAHKITTSCELFLLFLIMGFCMCATCVCVLVCVWVILASFLWVYLPFSVLEFCWQSLWQLFALVPVCLFDLILMNRFELCAHKFRETVSKLDNHVRESASRPRGRERNRERGLYSRQRADTIKGGKRTFLGYVKKVGK